MKKCDYGCGNDAKYQLKNSKNCCENSPNRCIAIKLKNSSSLKKAYEEGNKSKTITMPWLDNKRGLRKGKTIWSDDRVGRKFKKEEVFSSNSSTSTGSIKKIILAEKLIEYKCKECGIFEWNEKKISLELDHINGKRNDHRLCNLRFLCPNCHSQTSTFRGRNLNNGNTKVTDEDILIELKKGTSIRKVLLNLNMAPMGGNYKRVKKIIINNDFDYNVIKEKNVVEKKINKTKCKCLNCGNDCRRTDSKFCNTECYRNYERREKNTPKVPEILEAFKKYKDFTNVGRHFKVSDNAVRGWCKKYGIMEMIKVDNVN